MRVFEEQGPSGTATRLYNDVVQRGRKETITERDVDPADLAKFETIIRNKVEATGEKKGKIDYRDYTKYAPPRGADMNLSNVFGGFRYEVADDGTITMTDKYDFNPVKGTKFDDHIAAKWVGLAIHQTGLAAHIGRKIIGSEGGEGVPVKVTIRSGASMAQR
jgi:hypothetical protein